MPRALALLSVNGVNVEPGQTAFTRTPYGASSAANARVRPKIAALVASYCPIPFRPTTPNTDDMLTMLAPLALRSTERAAWQQFATPRIFVAIIRCHDSSGASASGKYSRIAALLTSTFSPPNSTTVLETASLVCSRLDTSAVRGKICAEGILREIRAASSSPFFLSTSTSATLAPSRQKRFAVVAPIPFAPPVIIAILPFSRPAISLYAGGLLNRLPILQTRALE